MRLLAVVGCGLGAAAEEGGGEDALGELLGVAGGGVIEAASVVHLGPKWLKALSRTSCGRSSTVPLKKDFTVARKLFLTASHVAGLFRALRPPGKILLSTALAAPVAMARPAAFLRACSWVSPASMRR